MNLKKEIRVETIFVSFVVSLMTILLLSILMNFDVASNTLGSEILKTNSISTQSANSVTSVVTYFRVFDTLG